MDYRTFHFELYAGTAFICLRTMQLSNVFEASNVALNFLECEPDTFCDNVRFYIFDENRISRCIYKIERDNTAKST